MSSTRFPENQSGQYFLTEGGVATELMYRWGFDLPEFAIYPLLEIKDSRQAIRALYQQYLDVVAQYQLSALVGGLDYRASPDWAAKLGYSKSSLRDAHLASIQFLRDIAGPYQGDIKQTLFSGYVSPRAEVYGDGASMTIQEAEDYHRVQLMTLKEAEVDLVWAMTFNNPAEAIGVVKAAKQLNLAVAVSFSLNRRHRLSTGSTLADAVKIVDIATESYAEFFSIDNSHPVEFEPAIEEAPWMQRIRCVRPNAVTLDKVAICKPSYWEEGKPAELGQQMADLGQRFPHLDIWGGSRGTSHLHLQEIARHLSS